MKRGPGSAGVFGLFYIALQLGSDYTFLHHNWNILNFPPTHLALAAIALRRSWWDRFERQRRIYWTIALAILVLLLAAWITGAVAQAIGPMLGVSLPIVLALCGRSYSSTLQRMLS